MDRILSPLPEYDVFAYLMVGIAALAASDLIFRSRFLIRDKWSITAVTLVVIAGYVAGQLISTPAEWILERLFVHQWLKSPAQHLVMSRSEYDELKGADFIKKCDERSAQFGGLLGNTVLSHRQPMPCATQQRIRQHPGAADGNRLFFQAYESVRYDANVRERLSVFSRLYSFSRNMAFVGLLAAFIVAIRAAWPHPAAPKQATKKSRAERKSSDTKDRAGISPWLFVPRWQFILFAAIGLGMFYRFVLFYRLYSVEVLRAFADKLTG